MGGKGGSNEIKETSQERANAEVAMKRYGRYMSVYRPLEEAAFNDLTSDASGAHIERVAGARINADSAQMLERNKLPSGVDPSRGAAYAAVNNPARAAIVADAASEAAGLGRKQKIAGLQTAANLGAGQINDVQLGFADLAGQSVSKAIDKQTASFNRSNQNTAALMSAIGMGASALTRPKTETAETK